MVIFFVHCSPSTRESIKVCRGEWSWLEYAKVVLFNWWSTWSAKGGKWDDVDALSYTLASGKGSSYARISFHCFKESEKILNKTPVWSINCYGTSNAPCWDGGQRSQGHPCSMDGVEHSQTYQYMRGIDRGRGLRYGATEACKPRWLSDRGQESVGVLQWMDLTTCDVSKSPKEFICWICVRKINRFVDNGPEIRIRCSGWRRQLCVKIQNKTKNGDP